MKKNLQPRVDLFNYLSSSMNLFNLSNHRYCWSLCLTVFLFEWHSYAGIRGINHLHIGISHILQLGSYHWHKWKTVEDQTLSLAEYHMNYLWILKPDLELLRKSETLLNRILTNRSYSLKSILEEVYQAEFCCLSYEMPFAGQSESCHYTLRSQNLSKFCQWGMIEIGLLNGSF